MLDSTACLFEASRGQRTMELSLSVAAGNGWESMRLEYVTTADWPDSDEATDRQLQSRRLVNKRPAKRKRLYHIEPSSKTIVQCLTNKLLSMIGLAINALQSRMDDVRWRERLADQRGKTPKAMKETLTNPPMMQGNQSK